jgi:hypothetical protein
MKVARTDSKRRIVLPDARAGDVFLVEEESGAGRYVVTRIHRPSPVVDPPLPEAPRTREEMEAALDSWIGMFPMSAAELLRETRELE